MKKIFNQYKEQILYLIFGGLTTLVSIAVYWLFNGLLGINELVANIISWIAAVTFAFFTNRIWVFAAPTKGFIEFMKQLISFFGSRLATLLLEEAIIGLFVTWLGFSSMVVKVVAQVVVIVLNYVLSKLWVFRTTK